MRTKNIAILGECMIELNGEPFGDMHQTYGGDTLNTATYLSRQTDASIARVHYVTAVGNDALSQGIVGRWQADGIDTHHVFIDEKRHMGLYLIQLDARGERTFLYWRNNSAARYVLQHADWQNLDLSQFDLLYLSGISLAILPDADRTKLVQQLICYSRSGGKLVLDSNYRPALWQDVAHTRECYRALLPHVNVALMTFDDEQTLWNDESPEASITRLSAEGVEEIVIKLGAEGVMYAKEDHRLNVPTDKVTAIVDTTAAGDAFNAGFLNGYLQQFTPERCCQQGNQLASIVIQHKGAIIPKTFCTRL